MSDDQTNNQIFSESQRELLKAVLNRIIPQRDDRPGAGDLGVSTFVEKAAAGWPGWTRLFNEGLRALDLAALSASSEGFPRLSDRAKDDALGEIEHTHPAFFEQLVQQTYNGYYTDKRILDIIGYNVPTPPIPGALPKLMDESLLDKQRQRAPFWRKL